MLEFWGNNFGVIDEAAGQATAKGRMVFLMSSAEFSAEH
jgi:hypothetical protein